MTRKARRGVSAAASHDGESLRAALAASASSPARTKRRQIAAASRVAERARSYSKIHEPPGAMSAAARAQRVGEAMRAARARRPSRAVRGWRRAQTAARKRDGASVATRVALEHEEGDARRALAGEVAHGPFVVGGGDGGCVGGDGESRRGGSAVRSPLPAAARVGVAPWLAPAVMLDLGGRRRPRRIDAVAHEWIEQPHVLRHEPSPSGRLDARRAWAAALVADDRRWRREADAPSGATEEEARRRRGRARRERRGQP